ncbi:hypothetical protein BGP76_14550 [Reichenbachiella sp. MSK19-1]|nr:hypothetical protein BGP76_14550 [Reichenbachiella sp. MSK19-1]
MKTTNQIMKSNLKNILWVTLMLVAGTAVAQDEDGDVQDAEIVIEKDRQIELEKETKLYEFIKWKPEPQTYEPVNPGEFTVFEYDLADEPQTFKSAKTSVQKKESEYHQYLKAGIGNYLSPLVDLSLVSPGDPNQNIGLNYKHLSYKTGEVDKENSASALNEISVYGTKVWKRVKTNAIVSYKTDANYYYGYADGAVISRQDIKKRNRFFSATLGLEDNNLNDDWEYSLNVGYRGFFDNYDNTENTMDVSGHAIYSEQFHLDAVLNMSSYNTASPQGRSHFRAKPYYNIEFGGIDLDAGLSVNLQSDDAQDMKNLKIFPYVSASYPLTDQYEAYVTLDGGYKFNTLYDFSTDIPYLNPQTIVGNTDNKVDVNLGVRGDVTDKWYARLNVGIKSMRNLPMYVNNQIDQQYIDVIYDTGVTKLFSIGVSSQYFINDKHNIELAYTFNNYAGGKIDTPYHLPTSELFVKGEHLFVDKLTLQWQYGLLAGITAYDGINDVDVSLDPINRLDISLHYQIQKRLGAFISSDNTIGKSYSRYLYYPQRGIQIKGGVTYRF